MIAWIKVLLAKFAPLAAGERGERLAATFLLREKGYKIVARNWRSPRDRRDELDLVVRDGDILVIVEVKTRAATALVPGYFAVNRRKRRVVQRAARRYVAGLVRKPRTVRFDVVEVSIFRDAKREPIIRHFENVPLFAKSDRLGG